VLDADGCSLDLTIEDVPGSVDWIESSGNELDGRIYSEHYNGHCRVTGTAALGGHRFDVDAPGWRDHSWGVRHWSSIACTRSLGGAFGGGDTFNFLSFLGTDGSLLRRGHVSREGKRMAASDIEIWVEIEEDGISARGGGLRCKTEDDTSHQFDFEVTGGMIGVTRERHGFESIVRVSAAGEREGWGFLEINNNPRLGSSGPFAALRDGLANGLAERSPSPRCGTD